MFVPDFNILLYSLRSQGKSKWQLTIIKNNTDKTLEKGKEMIAVT